MIAGRTPVVLSKYKDHVEKLYERLSDCADHVFLMTGNNSRKEHKAVRAQMQEIPDDENNCPDFKGLNEPFISLFEDWHFEEFTTICADKIKMRP